jgi:hypothetical protein
LTRRLSKTKGNPKAGIPSKHLENGVGAILALLSAIDMFSDCSQISGPILISYEADVVMESREKGGVGEHYLYGTFVGI